MKGTRLSVFTAALLVQSTAAFTTIGATSAAATTARSSVYPVCGLRAVSAATVAVTTASMAVNGALHYRSRRYARAETLDLLRDSCSVSEPLPSAVLSCSTLEEVESFGLAGRLLDEQLDKSLSRPVSSNLP